MQSITYNLGHRSFRQLRSVCWDTNVSLTSVRDVFQVVASLHRREAITGNASVVKVSVTLAVEEKFWPRPYSKVCFTKM